MMKLRERQPLFMAYTSVTSAARRAIADTMTNPAYRKAAFALMMQEQAPTLSMPEGTDLNAYVTLLIERFSNPSLRHRTADCDGRQPEVHQRLLDPVRLHLLKRRQLASPGAGRWLDADAHPGVDAG